MDELERKFVARIERKRNPGAVSPRFASLNAGYQCSIAARRERCLLELDIVHGTPRLVARIERKRNPGAVSPRFASLNAGYQCSIAARRERCLLELDPKLCVVKPDNLA
jgi:hypothetical protein